MIEKITITGKVIFQRAEEDTCVCCKGKHIYSRYVAWNKNIPVHCAFDNDYLEGIVQRFIKNKENKKVKITIEEDLEEKE